MSKAQAEEFRGYARDCFEFARIASSGEQRQSFLDKAAAWLRAATEVSGLYIPDPTIRPQASQDH
jgi:hypothetical protein